MFITLTEFSTKQMFISVYRARVVDWVKAQTDGYEVASLSLVYTAERLVKAEPSVFLTLVTSASFNITTSSLMLYYRSC